MRCKPPSVVRVWMAMGTRNPITSSEATDRCRTVCIHGQDWVTLTVLKSSTKPNKLEKFTQLITTSMTGFMEEFEFAYLFLRRN